MHFDRVYEYLTNEFCIKVLCERLKQLLSVTAQQFPTTPLHARNPTGGTLRMIEPKATHELH